MKCPSCKKGTIQIDNSVNEMSPYCDDCMMSFDQNYLDGYWDAMKELQVVTCIYCGKEYPPGTPTHGDKVSALTDHIRVCEKHPLREAEWKILKLEKEVERLLKENESLVGSKYG